MTSAFPTTTPCTLTRDNSSSEEPVFSSFEEKQCKTVCAEADKALLSQPILPVTIASVFTQSAPVPEGSCTAMVSLSANLQASSSLCVDNTMSSPLEESQFPSSFSVSSSKVINPRVSVSHPCECTAGGAPALRLLPASLLEGDSSIDPFLISPSLPFPTVYAPLPANSSNSFGVSPERHTRMAAAPHVLTPSNKESGNRKSHNHSLPSLLSESPPLHASHTDYSPPPLPAYVSPFPTSCLSSDVYFPISFPTRSEESLSSQCYVLSSEQKFSRYPSHHSKNTIYMGKESHPLSGTAESSNGESPPPDSSLSPLSRQCALDVLKCIVCCEFMTPPIFQCLEGHVLCKDCQKNVQSCPFCRCDTCNIRCRALEQLTETLTELPCTFANYGCLKTLHYNTKLQHEKNCPFHPLKCLRFECDFSALPDALVEHLIHQHGYEQTFNSIIHFKCQQPNGEILQDVETQQYIWQKHIYSCFNKHFVLRIHRRMDFIPQFYASVMVLHTKHHSHKYTLYISGNHRTYAFTGPVWTICRGFEELERVKDCLILPENIALFLSGGKGSESDLRTIDLEVVGEIYSS
ncbi:putative E3 ubiquitin-protein ligase SInaT4 [Cardiosporidium cionae]|uniref:RING-type E3 ubiquitin transferase n=1 Tax=Cardiosporidium cionae TaxID=476202 RepID=A0ABQ7J9N2_9APIC|nr:putative E3 ubiquitin-protein ligase SInaT4 [Cardiosporidium cionae]|eukprot:KAF8820666.1 putative E3 ubiquitin-protein ligase SInaT4 [Cardiosporidium cionae]